MEKVINYLKKILKKDDIIVVACSGGPDSMCLLDILVSLKDELQLKVICAHVNHKHRIESEDEEQRVKEYCDRNNIIFELYSILDYKNNKFTEDEARDKRYNYFNNLVDKYNAKYLMTAHHGDDLIETVLMRITRGSNLKGFVGFKKENNNIIRPLIDITKKDIYKYCEEKKLWYAIDITNDSMEYTRNRFRKNILPLLKKEDENIHKKFILFSNELNEYETFVDNYIDSIEDKVLVNGIVDIDNLLHEVDFIKRKVIERLISYIQQNDKLYINKKNVDDILDLVKSKKANVEINLNNKYVVIKEYNKLKIEKKNEVNEYKHIFDKYLNIDGIGILKVEETQEESNYVIRLNSEELELPLIIRSKQIGDKMFVKHLNGSKKVKDILIDEKVVVNKRKTIPILTDSANNILWMAGIKKSKFDKNINEKYDIIIKYEEE